MNRSIQSRLIFSASLILFCFLGLAGVVLDAAYQKGAQNALNDRLHIHLYSILSKAEMSKNNRLVMPTNLSEPRFSQVGSGLYAYIFDHKGEVVWRSSSSAGELIKAIKSLKSGQKSYIKKQSNSTKSVELHYKAILENAFSQSNTFEFVVIESTSGVDHQVLGFRSVLWQWLGGIGLILIIVQFWIIRVSLKPLRHIVGDIEKIQAGDAQYLDNHYSDELKDIANTLNRLIDNERTHLKRYRNTLADLAHSLKTPLSVLTGIYEKPSLSSADQNNIENQTLLMRQLVDYQLQKAAAKGHQTLSKSLEVELIVLQITDSLKKVYVDKSLNVIKDIEPNLKFNAEKGDFFELFGNLLDNAFKWADTTVRVSVKSTDNESVSSIQIIIEDDGSGIPEGELDNVLQRGIRADESVNGHGIGLAVVSELVLLYKGRLESSVGELGGQKWTIFLPKK